jgi:RND family efflux transporter MFP subunit
VKKGELIISLNEAPFKADRDLMQSHVDFQLARLTESQRDLKQQQELYERTVLSTVELENSELRVKRDTALLASAKAKLARANYDFSNSRLTAPFDALVMTVQVNEGQAINNALQTKTLVSLVRQGHFIARFSVDAAQTGKLKIETPVKVNISDTQYPAKISAIFYENAEKRYTVDARFSTESGSIPAGKKASVVIE